MKGGPTDPPNGKFVLNSPKYGLASMKGGPTDPPNGTDFDLDQSTSTASMKGGPTDPPNGWLEDTVTAILMVLQ